MSEILEKHRRIMERLERKPILYVKTREQNIQDKIRARYSIEDEIALINNYNLYIADNTLIAYKEEYEEYTAYRLRAKAEVDNESN